MNDMTIVENNNSGFLQVDERFYKSNTVFDEVTLKALSSSSTVSENLNGGQIQTLLNGFLYRALCVAIKHTRMFDDFSVYLIYYLISVKKRRITYVDKPIAINRLILFLFTNNRHCKYKLLKSLGIERYYLSRYLAYCQNKINVCFEQLTLAYDTLGDTIHTNLKTAAKSVGIRVLNIHEVYEKLRFYIDCYTQYRQQVISHYYKLCHKKARKQYKEKNNSSFDIHEIYQNYLLAVAKAIDKYDARRGAMTSYINWWILNVSTCDYSNYEYGIAYQIPSSYRRDMANHRVNQSNFSVSLENIINSSGGNSTYGGTSETATYLKDTLIAENSDHAQQYEEEDYKNRFKRLLKASDPTGLARIYLGIEEIFTSEERDRMQKHMRYLKNKLNH